MRRLWGGPLLVNRRIHGAGFSWAAALAVARWRGKAAGRPREGGNLSLDLTLWPPCAGGSATLHSQGLVAMMKTSRQRSEMKAPSAAPALQGRHGRPRQQRRFPAAVPRWLEQVAAMAMMSPTSRHSGEGLQHSPELRLSGRRSCGEEARLARAARVRRWRWLRRKHSPPPLPLRAAAAAVLVSVGLMRV